MIYRTPARRGTFANHKFRHRGIDEAMLVFSPSSPQPIRGWITPQLTIKLRSLVEYPRPVVAITRRYSGGNLVEAKKRNGPLYKNFHSPLVHEIFPPCLATRVVNRVYGWKPAGNFPIGLNGRATTIKLLYSFYYVQSIKHLYNPKLSSLR